MQTPDPLSGSQYYKIGDHVTFGWNYTSVSQMPTAIDVFASCSSNQATYTLTVNMTAEETGQVLVWDTGKYQKTGTPPLLTEQYTLIIMDADSSISAAPSAGYFGVDTSFRFGMYSPQAYTPWSGKFTRHLSPIPTLANSRFLTDYQCPTCSGAMSQMERQTMFFLFGMVSITILSFTWFGNIIGVF